MRVVFFLIHSISCLHSDESVVCTESSETRSGTMVGNTHSFSSIFIRSKQINCTAFSKSQMTTGIAITTTSNNGQHYVVVRKRYLSGALGRRRIDNESSVFIATELVTITTIENSFKTNVHQQALVFVHKLPWPAFYYWFSNIARAVVWILLPFVGWQAVGQGKITLVKQHASPLYVSKLRYRRRED